MDVAIMDFQFWRGQSKVASLLESVVNTLLGMVLAFFAQWLIIWFYEIPLNHTQNLIIVFWMTVLSVLRSYAVRRIANKVEQRKRGY